MDNQIKTISELSMLVGMLRALAFEYEAHLTKHQHEKLKEIDGYINKLFYFV